MPEDAGTLVVTAAGTAEKLSADLSATGAVRSSSIVTSIGIKARPTNTGNVYIGLIDRVGATATSSTYGWTLKPDDFFGKDDISEKFDNFEVDAATSGDKVDWWITYTVGNKAS